MCKEVLESIVKTIAEGGEINYELEDKEGDKIICIKLFDKEGCYIDTISIYYTFAEGIMGILKDKTIMH